ncbi:MAG: ribokinase [Anaerolineales bacterium]|nr:ribokinase [Anaerolineales bacterium]
MEQPNITVVGSFAVGMTMRTSRMPVFGETLIGRDFDMGPGGKGSNQAVGIARLGVKSCFAGIIGDDKLGEIAEDLYERENVDFTLLKKTDSAATGVGFIILDEAGDNGIILDMGANKLMDEAFVEGVEGQIASSSVVMSVLELPVAAAVQAMKVGKRHGVQTILNPAPATKMEDDVWQFIDYLTPNETELRILMGLEPENTTPTPVLAKKLQERGVKNLIITQGASGALIVGEGFEEHIPSVPVDVVDTTGAGDAFNAGLAVALVQGFSLPDAVRFAVCTGALTCTRLGVIPGLPYEKDVMDLYQKHFK